MRRTCGYIISLVAVILVTVLQVKGQDTLFIPLKINVGLEVTGPVTYLVEKKTFSAEGYISADLNEKFAAFLGGGYLNYEYSQYNYDYMNKGMFLKIGTDINILKPKKSIGKYWGGLGLRYGLSRFTWEVPTFSQTNYWGKSASSIPSAVNWGHFLEVSPGMRAEMFRNLSVGWSFSLRILLYSGAGKNLRPIYFPGFGNAGKTVSTGLNYFIIWNIPYKKIRVIIKKEVPPENEENEENPNQGGTTSPGNRQQSQGTNFR